MGDEGDRPRRGSLRETGSDPDARFTFANERTFLAWNRTALALILGGLAVAQLLDFESRGARLVASLPLIGLGAALGATSYGRWRANERAMRLGEPLPDSSLPLVLVAGLVVAALAALVVVVLEAA